MDTSNKRGRGGTARLLSPLYCLAALGIFFLAYSGLLVKVPSLMLVSDRNVDNFFSTGVVNLRQSHSQQMEEQTVLTEFFHRDGKVLAHGKFVEIGALDGNRLSNTWLLEHSLLWTGLLVEACPANFAKLKRNRPNCTTIGKAVCYPVPPSKSVRFSKDCSPSSGVMDTSVGDNFIRNVRMAEQGREVDVPCNTMASILGEAGLTHIDMFSIDVEGFEAKLVSSIDFSKVSIHVIVIEMDHSSSDDHAVISKVLSGAGFTSAGFIMGDELWVNDENGAKTTGTFQPGAIQGFRDPPIRILPGRALKPHEDAWLTTRDSNGKTTNFKPYASRFTPINIGAAKQR